FMDYENVCYMATLDSALQTINVASRQRLFRLAVWDADYFLSKGGMMIASGPIRIMYAIHQKPQSFRGPFPSGLVLPKLDAHPLGLDQGFTPQPEDLRGAIAKAKELLGLKERP